jgi:hypothetical protein
MKHSVDLGDLVIVAKRLKPLGMRCVFTGGAVITLLLDNPTLTVIRKTKDVDVIAEVVTRLEYTKLEELLRGIGFKHDMSEGAPKCRWIIEGIKVDVMPMTDQIGEFSDRWFDLALKTALPVKVLDETVLLVTAPCFVATKIEAFSDRGQGDFMASHDIEDILTVIDGRRAIIEEIAAAPAHLRNFIADSLKSFLSQSSFRDSLPGHLPPDEASQMRLPQLIQRIETAATLG